MYKIPNYQKIIDKAEKWRVDAYRYTVNGERVWVPKKEREQSTIPMDQDLIKKLGLDPADTILYIAGYFGTWANALAEAGLKVTYTELASDIVDFAKQKYSNNSNILDFICANFATIPKEKNKYDWTLSFEPVSMRSGLVLAAIRSLINKKGLKIVHYPRSIIPIDKFSGYELIADVYSCRFTRKEVFLNGVTSRGEKIEHDHIVTTIETNQFARKKALEDIVALEKNDLKPETIERLNLLAELFDEKYLLEI